MEYTSDFPHEECGVFGVFGVSNAAEVAFLGLHALQHRGQEGCGIVVADENGNFDFYKGQGLVKDVFDDETLAGLKGSVAIGHVRYSTAGGGGISNVQPLVFHQSTGTFAIAHNGNIVNTKALRSYLENTGSIFQSSSDSELVAHLIKKDPQRSSDPRIYSIHKALNMIEGAFAFLIMTGQRIYACRDKYGFRPLSLGKLGDGYVVSSETCALNAVGAEFVRDIDPGEVVAISAKGLRCSRYTYDSHHAMCAMEYIYFARPDSDIESVNVHAFRKESGRLLYHEAPADADIVVPVPDSSTSAAMGYSEASGLPLEMGLVKNMYVGRTFIQPSQEMRDLGVKMKLSTVKKVVDGKRLVLIDDSIVRGTTSKKIVRILRAAGAKEIHVRISSPMLISPCYYGVDISTREELLCARKDLEQACKEIGADSLAFLSEASLYKAGNRKELCLACFNKKYLAGEIQK